MNTLERQGQILYQREIGMTYQAIGNYWGVCGSRAEQIAFVARWRFGRGGKATGTNTIAVQAIYISPFFRRKCNAITLALGNIAHFALKRLIAAWAIFSFVKAHKAYKLKVMPPLIKKGIALYPLRSKNFLLVKF